VTATLDDYAALLGAPEIDELRALAGALTERDVLMVNSTAVGGGVAEILDRLVPLAREVGVRIRWEVVEGGADFYDVTKAFHNALHGGPYELPPEAFEIFLAYNEHNRKRLDLDASVTVIHDPQPVALIRGRARPEAPWIWRCHIDLSRRNPKVWEFLKPFVQRYDGAVFSSPAFAQQLPIPQYLFFPSIDPLSDKNRELDAGFVHGVLDRFGIDRDRPIITQISRFDRLKDPVGVVRAFKIVQRYFDCQLVLAGGGASDDPEGAAVLEEAREAGAGDASIHILELPASAPLEVNALQRASTVILQKSLREGFGLTVAEALWKKRPVVASAVGGIPLQVIHKHTGLLAHSVEGTAYQIRFLLAHPEIAARLGEHGHEHVRENFLVTRNLRNYLFLFLALQRARRHGSAPVPSSPSVRETPEPVTAASNETAERTEVEVQLVRRQSETLAHGPEGFLETHQRQANGLDLGVGQRARLHAPDRLPLEQLAQKLHERQHELRHGSLHVGGIGVPSRGARRRQAPLQFGAQRVDVAGRKRIDIVGARGPAAAGACLASSGRSLLRPGAHEPRPCAGARSFLHRRNSGTNA
jgi:trehalose synthase